jgi:hypothetical protein
MRRRSRSFTSKHSKHSNYSNYSKYLTWAALAYLALVFYNEYNAPKYNIPKNGKYEDKENYDKENYDKEDESMINTENNLEEITKKLKQINSEFFTDELIKSILAAKTKEFTKILALKIIRRVHPDKYRGKDGKLCTKERGEDFSSEECRLVNELNQYINYKLEKISETSSNAFGKRLIKIIKKIKKGKGTKGKGTRSKERKSKGRKLRKRKSKTI